jgi:hypothetical protein
MSFETATLRCRNCKFWWPLADGDHPANRQRSPRGACRRYAPPALLKESGVATEQYPSWAITLKEDWCGEHLHTEM